MKCRYSTSSYACRIVSCALLAVPILLMSMSTGARGAEDVAPAGQDLAAYINQGHYDFILGGDATWNSNLEINSLARSTLTIDGQGNTVLFNNSGGNMISNFNYNGSMNVALRNITFQSNVNTNNYILGFAQSDRTINLDLYGTTFTGFNRTNDKGGTVVYVSANNSTINITGGDSWDTALTFLNNRAEWDANGAIAVANGTLNLNGYVIIDGNRSGNYGGAVAIYETGTALNFNGPTIFRNNVSGVFGGGLDVWGGNAKVTFDDVVTFDNNSVYFNPNNPNTYEEPRHVTDQHARGGAINVGYIASGNTGTVLTFNSEATFTGNHVISLGASSNNRNAYGGAISVYGNNTTQNYQLIFNDAAIFRNNYVYALNGAGNGGAIYYDTGGATLSLVGGTIFEDNYASTYGGAIYLQAGNINLTADTDDITFQGNRQGVTFTGNAPVAGTGTPNAIYLGSGGNLNLEADAGRIIHFYDPVASIAGSSVIVNKTGDGDVVFYGDGSDSGEYDSVLQATTTVSGGRFVLRDGVAYGSTSYGTFTVANGGTLLGDNGASVKAQAVVVQNGGTLSVDDDTFTIDAATINLQSGAILAGDGTLAATSNLNTTGTFTAAIDDGDTLEVTATLVGTGSLDKAGDGVLELAAQNSYSGTTTVSEGTLRGGVANAFSASSAVTVEADGTLELGGYNQSAKNLSGSGDILLDGAVLTAQIDSAQTFSGTITGDGSLTKTGAANFTVSGDNSYTGGTAISTGRLIATSGSALGTGLVSVTTGTTLELNYAGEETFVNRLTGSGALEKTGAGTATLTASNSTIGAVSVLAGTLGLEETGVFSATSYRTYDGATTFIGNEAKLYAGTSFVQDAGATLTVAIGTGNQPAVTATTASIDGDLNITGFDSGDLAKASMVEDEQFVVIQTTGGISGTFESVEIEAHGVTQDYLTVTGSFSSDRNRYLVGLGLAWNAAATVASGNFTLVDAADTFEVDVVLANRDGITSGWNGTDLVKMGAGTLILSEENTYTGLTDIRDGTLRTGADNAFADSRQVNVAAGALLDLDGYDQVASNLNGAGNIELGDATLTANYTTAQTISGVISGTGDLVKTGDATLTLAGTNTYSGGTTVEAGRVRATSGNALGTGAADVANGATVELALTTDADFASAFTGDGTLEKTGTGTARLTATGSDIATVNVAAGEFFLDMNGVFNAGDYTTRNGATTTIGENTTMVLTGAYVQEAGGTLDVTIGSNNEPAITASSATLNGTLNVTGFAADLFTRASNFDGNRYIVVQTDTAMSKGFDDVNIGTVVDPVDYLTIGGFLTNGNTQYVIEFGLTWYTDPALAHGTFTLTDPTDTFTVDVVLADRDDVTSGWDGQSLTKAGEGTLILAAQNTYTGSTTVEEGTLRAGVANAFATSTAVDVQSGAILDLNSLNQVAQNLTGSGDITLGSATLEARNSQNTAFAGDISGTGRVNKTGAATLTLSGTNTYTGGTTVSAGRLVAGNVNAIGTGTAIVSSGATLELNTDADADFANALSGAGTFEKTGTGTVGMTNLTSNIGAVLVSAGGLSFDEAGVYRAGSYTTANGATTSIGNESQLVITNAFTQRAGSTLNVAVGNNDPAVRAATAAIDGTLDVTGFDDSGFSKASDIPAQAFTIIATTGGITGTFEAITINATSPADYLTIGTSFNDARTEFFIDFGLTWYAAADVANGNFTLDAGDSFDVDVVLADRDDVTSGWDGHSLTKLGDGTLILSAVNTYTGDTDITAGTLQLGVANAIAASGAVTVAAGAELDLNNFNQNLNNLSGAGDVLLGSANLTADYDDDLALSGTVSGTGSVTKTGDATLTLSGDNTYTGGTTVAEGTVIASSYTALGTGTARVEDDATLELALNADGAFGNVLAGAGDLVKSGSGVASMTATGSSIGSVDITGGGLSLEQNGAFSAGDFTVRTGTSLAIGDESQLVLTGTYVQESGADLYLAVGDNEPAITANAADLNGTLTVTGFDTGLIVPASTLTTSEYVVVRTTTAMTKGFDDVDIGTSTGGIDYLTADGFLRTGGLEYYLQFGLTWYADPSVAHGTFTLDEDSIFNVDVALNDRTEPITSGWDGESLTKEGDGTLILSAQNLYTGTTTVNGGTLATGDAVAFANSSAVTVNTGATLALNGPAQTARNLGGTGDVVLGDSTVATVISSTDTTLSGSVSGGGSLVKTGTATFTLSGDNSYTGGTTVAQGSLVTTTGTALGTGTAQVNGGANLTFDFIGDETVSNSLAGTGSLLKDGAGTAHLTGSGSSIGDVTVADGTLSLEGTGTFTAANYTTEGGATTVLGGETQLVVDDDFIQESGSTLNVAIGEANEPNITADTAVLAGDLFVSGFSLDTITRASLLPGSLYTVIETTGGITGDFDNVAIDNAMDPTDYLTVTGQVVGNNYDIGLALTWFAGPDKAHGTFTIDGSGSFEVDVDLTNQTGPFTSGWDGETLTKAGLGTLILSRQNSSTGGTIIEEGTLQTNIANAFADSSEVVIEAGATLDMNGNSQIATNLSGGGTIEMGNDDAVLTAVNDTDTSFDGVINGAGSLVKDGAADLTLSGDNTYTGGTTISDGSLIATTGNALGAGDVAIDVNGTLNLNFTDDMSFANELSGDGALVKTGSGTATLTAGGSSVGSVSVDGGTLELDMGGVFTVTGDYTTGAGATTDIDMNSSLDVAGTFEQEAGSSLTVCVDGAEPIITANAANLAGTLNVGCFDADGTGTASNILDRDFVVIDSQTVISGDFVTVNILDTTSPVDYLTISGRKSGDGLQYLVGFQLTWYLDTNANGTFTITGADDQFILDVVLADRGQTFPGWDGESLTKKGAGTLVLAAENTYTGSTHIEEGTIRTDVDNAFAESSDVIIDAGATLDVNGTDQVAQNLQGAGSIELGDGGNLTASNDATDTEFAGTINGDGTLRKTGDGTLTLSGQNTYTGGTAIDEGTLAAANDSALGAGDVTVADGATLDLAIADGTATFGNTITGDGDLIKTGGGTAELTGTGSSAGSVTVEDGTLYLDMNGSFAAGSYTTTSGATTDIGYNSDLDVAGAFTQEADSTLSVQVGWNNEPMVSAGSADIAGTLTISNFDPTIPASVLVATRHIIIESDTPITGDFDEVDFGGLLTGVDFLILDGQVDAGGLTYSAGFGLAWYAGPAEGTGSFTLLDPDFTFDVDVALTDQSGVYASGWNGRDLTKNGEGTLILSATNSYTGATTVNGGTLLLTADDALGQTSSLTIADGATVGIDGTDQTVGRLTANTGSTLALNGGSLTIDSAQREAGDTTPNTIGDDVLAGDGSLNLVASDLDVDGSNNRYVGDVTASGGSNISLSNADGLGNSGSLTLTGNGDSLEFAASPGGSAGAFGKDISGDGTVSIRDGQDVSFTGDNAGFAGQFDIDDGGTMRAGSAENLGSAGILADGTLVLTSDGNWRVDNTVTGDGEFIKDGAGQVVIGDGLAGFAGTTRVAEGVLIVGDDIPGGTAVLGGSHVQVDEDAVLSGTGRVDGSVFNEGYITALNALDGYENAGISNFSVGALTNAGAIQLAGRAVGNTLTVRGGMTSNNGSLIINTVLGGDDSPTDRLILDGGATVGTTQMVVNNAGGGGAQTNVGILVVDAQNGATTTGDAFSLSSVSRGFRDGFGTIAAGAYDYTLVRGGNGGEEQSWYLVSDENARPEVGAHLANREAAESLFYHSLYDRLEGYEKCWDFENGGMKLGRAWGRMQAGRERYSSDRLGMKTVTKTYVLQTGMDVWQGNVLGTGSFRAGIMGGLGNAWSRSEPRGEASMHAKGRVEGYQLGLYGTWFADRQERDGLYVDAWVQHAWFRNKTSSSGLASEKYNSRLWTFSLESGYAFSLYRGATSAWSVVPTVQIAYNDFVMGKYTEATGTLLDHRDNGRFFTRAGVRLKGKVADQGFLSSEPYAEVNWKHASKNARLFMNDQAVRMDSNRNAYELKLGIEKELRRDLRVGASVSGEIGERKYRRIAGQLGISYQW